MSGECKPWGGRTLRDGGGRVGPVLDAAPAPAPYRDVGKRDAGRAPRAVGPAPSATGAPPPPTPRASPDAEAADAHEADVPAERDAGGDGGGEDAAPGLDAGDSAADARADVHDGGGPVDAGDGGGAVDVADSGDNDADAGSGEAGIDDAGPGCDLACALHQGNVTWILWCEGEHALRSHLCEAEVRDDQGRLLRQRCEVTYVDSGRSYTVTWNYWYEGGEPHGSIEVSDVGTCLF